jgi:hypothetical protein
MCSAIDAEGIDGTWFVGWGSRHLHIDFGGWVVIDVIVIFDYEPQFLS